MAMLAFKARDGRGQRVRVPLLSFRDFFRWPRRGTPQRSLRLWRTLAWSQAAARFWLIPSVSAAIAMLYFVKLLLDARSGYWFDHVQSFMMTAMFVSMATLWRPYWRTMRRNVERRSGNERPMCAACGYDLSGSRAEPDGCTVCAECGAAWRLAG